MSRRLRPILIAAVLIVGTWMVMPADAQGRFWVLVNGAMNYNGPIRVGIGTASVPGVAFAVDPSTGLYRISAGTIGITTTGTTRATVNSAGVNVGSGGMFGFSSNADPSAQAADTALTRVAAGQFGWTAVLFTNLGTPASGTFCYCSDCTIANPCASGGTGALAKRLNGVWVCN